MEKIAELWVSELVKQPFLDRFWAKISRRGDIDCWPWLATTNPQGYGIVHVAGKLRPASRVAFAIANPHELVWRGSHICHKCDNPPCCNPAHLWQDTPGANSLDKIRKGRGPTKLSDAAVLEIRESAVTFAAAKLCGKKFGISAGHARLIARGIYCRTR